MQETHSPTDPFTEKSLSVSAVPAAFIIGNRSGMALPELGPLACYIRTEHGRVPRPPSAATMGFTKPSKRQLDVKTCGFLLHFVFCV